MKAPHGSNTTDAKEKAQTYCTLRAPVAATRYGEMAESAETV